MGNSPLSHLRILLVDDHALFLGGLRNLLATEGIQVVGTACDGLEALEKARSLRPDVILMDVEMPRCDGLAATRLIKAELPEIKIVMLTMSEDEQDLFEAVKSGASGYLLKRLDPDQFFAFLADLQAGLLPFSPGLGAKLLNEFARLANGAPAPSGSAGAATDSAPGDAEAMQTLSSRQIQILTLVAMQKTYRQVADTLNITERTVKYHMSEIMDRLHLENRAQVMAFAARVLKERRGEKRDAERRKTR
jgi:DNA-binding NarL/FixJ family response regulator